MPMVLFTMVIMSVMAIAALNGAADQQRASMATRKSGEAFYVAETGLSAVMSEWNDTTSTLDSTARALSSGGILDLGWDTLPTGATYHGEVLRLDDGSGQAIFLLTVVGQDAQGYGEREVSLLLTGGSGSLILGGCCQSAAMVRGEVAVKAHTQITGTDTDPPLWSSSVCDPYPENNKPGITNDADGIGLLSIDDESWVSSGDSMTNTEDYLPEPAVVLDAGMDNDTFDQYGTRTWGDVRDMATTVIGNGPGSQLKLKWGGDPATDNDKFGPRYHFVGDGHGHVAGDPEIGTCDTTHPLNFGAPSGPCANHFPIILVEGEVEIKDIIYEDDPYGAWEQWYMQGVVILDTLVNGEGSEFEFESPGTFAGIIIGKGCIQLEDGSQSYGAIFVDGDFYNNDTCEQPPLQINDGDNAAYEHTDLYYSDCVVQEVLRQTGMGEVDVSTSKGSQRVAARAFHELLR